MVGQDRIELVRIVQAGVVIYGMQAKRLMKPSNFYWGSHLIRDRIVDKSICEDRDPIPNKLTAHVFDVLGDGEWHATGGLDEVGVKEVNG